MRKMLIVPVVLLAVALSIGTDVAAKKKPFVWDEITEDDWGVTPDSSRKIFDAVVLFEKIERNDKDMEHDEYNRTVYRRIRILGSSGRDWADVEVPYLHEKQKITNICARTVLQDGSVFPMADDHIFEKETVKSKKMKIKQTNFSIPGVSDDCIIEYAVSYRLPSPVTEWIIQQDIPVLKAELRWVLGKLKMSKLMADLFSDFVTPNYLWLNAYTQPIVTQLPNIKAPETLFFEIGYIAPFEEVPYTVPDNARKTKLYCYYGSSVAADAYWGTEALTVKRGRKNFCEKNKLVRKLVTRWMDLKDDKAKIAAAFAWVRDSIFNVTYHDRVDEKGKKQKTKENNTVDDVLKNRYGTRRDIDHLFCDILRELNIDAKTAFLKDRIKDLFVPEAKYWQMNRSLVAIESASADCSFYSPGHDCTPLGMVPWYCEGVEAIVGGGTESLVPIPFSESSVSLTNLAYNFGFTDDMEIKGSLTARLNGHTAHAIRTNLSGEDSADFNDLVKEKISEYVPEAELDSVEFDRLDSCEAPFRVSCRAAYPAVSLVGNRILLKPFQYLCSVENPFTDPDRTMPVLFEYAYTMNESAQFEIPEGYAIEALPSDSVYENVVGNCNVQFKQLGSVLVVQRYFTLNAPYWSSQYYPSIQELYQARLDMSEQIAILSRASDTGLE